MAGRADAIIVGGGLRRPRGGTGTCRCRPRVVILEQEGENSLGGQGLLVALPPPPLGGLILRPTVPKQRRMKIRDSRSSRCRTGWVSASSTARRISGPRKVRGGLMWIRAARIAGLACTSWAIAGFRSLAGRTRRAVTPMATGNSVAAVHLAWGSRTGVVAPYERRVRAHVVRGDRAEVPPSREPHCPHQWRGIRRCRRGAGGIDG